MAVRSDALRSNTQRNKGVLTSRMEDSRTVSRTEIRGAGGQRGSTETSCFSMCTDWLRTMIKADVPLMISDNFLEVMHGRLW